MSASMPKDMRHIKTIIIAQRVYKQALEGWWVVSNPKRPWKVIYEDEAGNQDKPRVK